MFYNRILFRQFASGVLCEEENGFLRTVSTGGWPILGRGASRHVRCGLGFFFTSNKQPDMLRFSDGRKREC